MDDNTIKQNLVKHFQSISIKESDDWFIMILNQRVEFFASAESDHIYLDWLSFDSTDIRIAYANWGRSHITFALLDNQRILWLDNHIQYDDYIKFSKRENLLEKFDNDLEGLAQFIIQTYLGHQFFPVLINGIDDIPMIQDQELFGTQPFVKKDVDAKNLLLKNLSYDIMAPKLYKVDENMVSLKFTSWTEYLGWLRHTRILFKQDGEIVNMLNTDLAKVVGRHSSHL